MVTPELAIVSEKCNFCSKADADGFVEVKTLTGVKIKAACAACAKKRRLQFMSHEEVERARWEKGVVALFRPFISKVFGEPTDTDVEGISEKQESFSCQVANCPCGGESVSRADLVDFEKCGLKFLVITAKRADAVRVLRALVVCDDFLAIAKEVLGEEINALPLAECDLFTENEPGVTIGVGKAKGTLPKPPIPPALSQLGIPPAITVTPSPLAPPPPKAVSVVCSKNSTMSGDPVGMVQSVRPIWARLISTLAELDEATAYARAEISRLVEGHRPGTVVDWEKFGSESVHQLYGLSCALHGMTFGKLVGMHRSLVSRRTQLVSRPRMSVVPSKPRADLATTMVFGDGRIKSPNVRPAKEKPMCKICGTVRVKQQHHVECYECYRATHPRSASTGKKKGNDEKKKKKSGDKKAARQAAIAAVSAKK